MVREKGLFGQHLVARHRRHHDVGWRSDWGDDVMPYPVLSSVDIWQLTCSPGDSTTRALHLFLYFLLQFGFGMIYLYLFLFCTNVCHYLFSQRVEPIALRQPYTLSKGYLRHIKLAHVLDLLSITNRLWLLINNIEGHKSHLEKYIRPAHLPLAQWKPESTLVLLTSCSCFPGLISKYHQTATVTGIYRPSIDAAST